MNLSNTAKQIQIQTWVCVCTSECASITLSIQKNGHLQSQTLLYGTLRPQRNYIENTLMRKDFWSAQHAHCTRVHKEIHERYWEIHNICTGWWCLTNFHYTCHISYIITERRLRELLSNTEYSTEQQTISIFRGFPLSSFYENQRSTHSAKRFLHLPQKSKAFFNLACEMRQCILLWWYWENLSHLH